MSRPISGARRLSGVGSGAELYRRLASSDTTTYAANAAGHVPQPDAGARDLIKRPVASGLTQWAVLTRRTVETFLRKHAG